MRVQRLENRCDSSLVRVMERKGRKVGVGKETKKKARCKAELGKDV